MAKHPYHTVHGRCDMPLRVLNDVGLIPSCAFAKPPPNHFYHLPFVTCYLLLCLAIPCHYTYLYAFCPLAVSGVGDVAAATMLCVAKGMAWQA